MYYNKSYTYALPMLDWWDSGFLVNKQLRGCFLGDSECPDLNNHIFLLYKYDGERWYQNFEEELKENEYYVDFYDPTKLHVMYVFRVPERHKENMEMLKASKFSLMNDGFKKQIVEFHGEERAKNVISVLYKHESAYVELEKYINQGLPRKEWTKIPRDVEASKLLNLNATGEPKDEEIYSKNIKFKEDKGKDE